MPSKYNAYSSVPQRTVDHKKVHPIWRGIGLIFMVLTPLLGFLGAILLLQANERNAWLPLPADLLIPGKDPLLLIKVILTLILMFILLGIFQLIAAFIYRLFAPPRYGPTDVPPVSYRGRKMRR